MARLNGRLWIGELRVHCVPCVIYIVRDRRIRATATKSFPSPRLHRPAKHGNNVKLSSFRDATRVARFADDYFKSLSGPSVRVQKGRVQLHDPAISPRRMTQHPQSSNLWRISRRRSFVRPVGLASVEESRFRKKDRSAHLLRCRSTAGESNHHRQLDVDMNKRRRICSRCTATDTGKPAVRADRDLRCNRRYWACELLRGGLAPPNPESICPRSGYRERVEPATLQATGAERPVWRLGVSKVGSTPTAKCLSRVEPNEVVAIIAVRSMRRPWRGSIAQLTARRIAPTETITTGLFAFESKWSPNQRRNSLPNCETLPSIGCSITRPIES